MIKKEDLKELEDLKKEYFSLDERINKIENKTRNIVSDSVKGSFTEFPYTQHNCKITGLDNSITYRRSKNTLKKLKKMYKSKKEKIEKIITNIEYELNYIKDSELREIIRLKYEDGLNWVQIMHRRGYTSEDAARKKVDRFFEKK